MSIAEASKSWEKRVVEGKFPLQTWLGASDHSAVFQTQRGSGQEFQRASIKLVGEAAGNLGNRLSQWRAAAQLSHPHLIQIFQNGPCIIDGSPLLYLVTEYADEALSQILPQRSLAASEASEMLPPLLDALSYVHKKGLVHGSLRPSNLLAVGDQLKLSSDHISAGANSFALKATGDPYVAPEAAEGQASPASDIWSLGITLLAALTQKTSITRDSRGDPVIPATVPEPFRGIIRECLHLDPRRRCSPSDILARLQPAARSVPAEAAPAPKPPKPKSASHGAIGLAIVAIAVLIGLVIIFSRGTKEKPTAPATTTQAPAPAAAPPKPSPAPEAAKPESKGVAVHQVLPEVSTSARNTITGKIRVVVRVNVDSAGKVTDAKLTSPGPSRYFANLALKAARGWEFSPPTTNGQAVPSVWVIRFRFGRARTEAAPERLRH
ncbi:MAG TPA: TonB family protein [Candidatus Sulfotelmatobacter sp.]|nr:TonB family protein [Candidatus Sulfotelmatobacter sp.]